MDVGLLQTSGVLCVHVTSFLAGDTRVGWQAHGVQAPSALLPRQQCGPDAQQLCLKAPVGPQARVLVTVKLLF